MGKKWNQDAKPSEKLLSMYTMLLFSGREASLSEVDSFRQVSKKGQPMSGVRLCMNMEKSLEELWIH